MLYSYPRGTLSKDFITRPPAQRTAQLIDDGIIAEHTQ